jgi:hypothetical protein
MAKEPGFAKAYAGRRAHYRNGHQATFANAAGFFNSLLGQRPLFLARHFLNRPLSKNFCWLNGGSQPLSGTPMFGGGSRRKNRCRTRKSAVPKGTL